MPHYFFVQQKSLTMIKYIFAVLTAIFLPFFSANAQKNLFLPDSARTKIYIFKASKTLVREYFESGRLLTNSFDLSDLRDSVSGTDFSQVELYLTNSPKNDFGDYLMVKPLFPGYSVKVFQKYDLTIDFYDNSRHCILDVFGKDGNKIHDAEVFLGKKKLAFQKKTKVYFAKNPQTTNFLEIRRGEKSYFFRIKKEKTATNIKIFEKKLRQKKIFRYTVIPIRNVILFPYDITMSAIKGYPQNGVWLFGKAFFSLKNFIGRITDAFWWDEDEEDFMQKKAMYYFDYAHNKPFYRIGDTLFAKIYLMNKKFKPIKKEIKVTFEVHSKVYTKTRKPYAAGAYTFDFILADSLDLQEGSHCDLHLYDNKKLAGNFSVIVKNKALQEIYPKLTIGEKKCGEGLKLQISGTDENELPLKNAEAVLKINKIHISQSFDKNYFMPDSIETFTVPLEARGETEFTIPAHYLPDAELEFVAHLTVRTSDNRMAEIKKMHRYNFPCRKIKFEEHKDSLRFFLESNEPAELRDTIKIYGTDMSGKKHMIFCGKQPAVVKINPFFSKYEAESPFFSTKIVSENDLKSKISAGFSQEANKLLFSLRNPRKLPLIFYVFKNDRLTFCRLTAGDTVLELKAGKGTLWTVQYGYFWNGKAVNNAEKFVRKENEIFFNVKQARQIIPGQKVETEVYLTNRKGKPISNADLTAFAYKNSFEGYAYKYSSIEKPSLNHFFHYRHFYKINLLETDFGDNFLSDSLSKKMLQNAPIDSLFYPHDKIFHGSFPVADSLTQFAPFIFNNGIPVNVQSIFCQEVPLYFKDFHGENPYSFPLSNHTDTFKLKIRTKEHEILISKFKPIHFHKNIISLDIKNCKDSTVQINKMSSNLTENETHWLKNSIFKFKTDQFGSKILLRQEGSRTWLVNQTGAIAPIFSRNIEFFNFQNREKIFSFEFENNHDYVISPPKIRLYPLYLTLLNYRFRYSKQELLKINAANNINAGQMTYFLEDDHKFDKNKVFDTLFTVESYQNYFKKTHRKENYYPPNGFLRHGLSEKSIFPIEKKARIELSWDEEKIPDFKCLLLKNTEGKLSMKLFLNNTLHQPSFIPSGKYTAFFFAENGLIYETDTIEVLPNGKNYCFIKDAKLKKPEDLEKTVSEIWKEIQNYSVNDLYFLQDERSGNYLFKNLNNMVFHAGTQLYEGLVIDTHTRKPISFCLISSGSVLTNADEDGYFRIYLPQSTNEIAFSFLGYKNRKILSSNFKYVTELDSEFTFQDVVVSSIGIIEKRNYTGSTARALQGRTNGVIINYHPGQSSTIRIRGTSSINSSDKPLILIDNVPFSGDFFRDF